MKRAAFSRILGKLDLKGLDALVHVSLAACGLANTEAEMVCEALIKSVGARGTIVMPTFTHSETLPGAGTAPIAFHPDMPVSAGDGPVSEMFRKLPGVLRSNHPSHSFAAYGPRARVVLSTQRDNNPLGPIKKLNVMQGQVLLLGTSLSACAALYVAEEAAAPAYLGRGTALRINAAGYEERVVLEQVPGCSRAFDRLEPQLDAAMVTAAPLLRGTARRISIRHLVRLAATALGRDPALFVCNRDSCEACAMKRAAISAQRGPLSLP